MKLACSGLSCGYGGRAVLTGIDLAFSSGDALCLLGPNGAGKTTLFRTLLGFIPPVSGAVALDGRDIARLSRRELARAIAYVPQGHTPPFPFQVMDVVLMGRNPHLGISQSPGDVDRGIARDAIDRLGIGTLSERPYTDLSGGERQLVLIARALAQQARLVILDEPASHLDLGNQVRLLARLRELARTGIGILMTTHNPQHAFLWADRVALLAGGAGCQVGPPDEMLSRERLSVAYGVDLMVVEANAHGERVRTCIPLLPAVDPDRKTCPR
ncbi:MAG: ABC transporter ATP-binding protein [Planctomycetes bacterium]|nr:ABC transporter ATP-binding protein [Planctomycetota bacterium]